jgi:hypothetical protein
VQRRLARLLRDREAVSPTRAKSSHSTYCIVAGDARFETAVKDGTVQEDLYRRLAATRIGCRPSQSPGGHPGARELLPPQACAEAKSPKAFSQSALSLLAAAADQAQPMIALKTIVSGFNARTISIRGGCAPRLSIGLMVSHSGTLRRAHAQFRLISRDPAAASRPDRSPDGHSRGFRP